MSRTTYLLCLLIALAVVVAGCGGGDDGPGEGAYGIDSGGKEPISPADDEKPEKEKGIRASIWRADSAEIKRGIFDFDGYTLYRFGGDTGSKPTCYGACAKKWPPLITELKPYGVDVVKSKIGTTKRKDGTIQVTYFGYPLYTYVGDKKKSGVTGLVNGHNVEAFGGTWYALKANGQDAPG
ncbi:MAG TPA: hypothetical protein VFM51_11505 [Solirubrobacterales bacterium]|nr:hypothetical protein [Solirubrobacterales bacterium]